MANMNQFFLLFRNSNWDLPRWLVGALMHVRHYRHVPAVLPPRDRDDDSSDEDNGPPAAPNVSFVYFSTVDKADPCLAYGPSSHIGSPKNPAAWSSLPPPNAEQYQENPGKGFRRHACNGVLHLSVLHRKSELRHALRHARAIELQEGSGGAELLSHGRAHRCGYTPIGQAIFTLDFSRHGQEPRRIPIKFLLLDDSIFPRRSCVHFFLGASIFLHLRKWMRDASLRDELSLSSTHNLAASTELAIFDSANSDASASDGAAPFTGPEAPGPADIAGSESADDTTCDHHGLVKPNYDNKSLAALGQTFHCSPPTGSSASPEGEPQEGPWKHFLVEAAIYANRPSTSSLTVTVRPLSTGVDRATRSRSRNSIASAESAEAGDGAVRLAGTPTADRHKNEDVLGEEVRNFRLSHLPTWQRPRRWLGRPTSRVTRVTSPLGSHDRLPPNTVSRRPQTLLMGTVTMGTVMMTKMTPTRTVIMTSLLTTAGATDVLNKFSGHRNRRGSTTTLSAPTACLRVNQTTCPGAQKAP